MFVKVAKLADIADGGAICVEADGNQIALFKMDGECYALDNTCPHRGGPLSAGYFDPVRRTVQCPWHGWMFNCLTGISPINPLHRVQKYDVKIEGDEIYVDVD